MQALARVQRAESVVARGVQREREREKSGRQEEQGREDLQSPETREGRPELALCGRNVRGKDHKKEGLNGL